MDRVEKYRRLPDGFPTLLNKMLRAVLVSRPLEAVRFFADYLEAEVNRRTLCDLQLRQPCPSGEESLRFVLSVVSIHDHPLLFCSKKSSLRLE